MSASAKLSAALAKRHSPERATGLLLRVENLAVHRGGRALFQHMAWELRGGQVMVVTGPSGTGKSSLLACLAGLLEPSEGRVVVCPQGRQGPALEPRAFRPHLGVIFQRLHLVPQLSLMENVLCGCLGRWSAWRTLWGFPPLETARARNLLEEFGLGHVGERAAREASGGEQQRTAVARALMQEPKVLLADEPVSDLDPTAARLVLERLFEEASARGCAVVCSLHGHPWARERAHAWLQIGPGLPLGWRLVGTSRCAS